MASPVIELQNVSLSFDGEFLLRNISLSISAGEAFVLIGPSGHGKSSLLKLMGGLIPPTEGRVLIEGCDLYSMQGGEREKLARKMGMLFQKNALFDSLTSAENIAFPLVEVANASALEVEQAIGFYLDAVGIGHARSLYPDEMSGGMQKRLGIARALALEPEIVFYDDPTAGLDPITSKKIIELIINLQLKLRSTLVAVTNDMVRAKQLAHRVAMVVDQEVILCGNPQEMETHPDPRVQQFIHGRLQGPLTMEQS